MNTGSAIEALKMGHTVARKGWNGKGMLLFLSNNGSALNPDYPDVAQPVSDAHVMLAPHVVMKTADGSFVPWLCSQTDLLAEDWELVD